MIGCQFQANSLKFSQKLSLFQHFLQQVEQVRKANRKVDTLIWKNRTTLAFILYWESICLHIICLFVTCLSLFLSVHLLVSMCAYHLSIRRLSISISVCPTVIQYICICQSDCLPACLPVWLTVHLSVCPSGICLSFCPSVHLSISLSVHLSSLSFFLSIFLSFVNK